MKFIVDAHLPYQLKIWLNKNGEDVIHTRNLPLKNLTGDIDIIGLSMREDRIVIT